MIDHISLPVTRYSAAKDFYLRALAPLGYELMMEFPGGGGLKCGDIPDLWLVEKPGPVTTIHLAFHTEDRALVDAFHMAALEAGGKDNGGPGVRAHYHPNYYAAFVFDPDGHNIEVVCHQPVEGD